MATYVLVHGGWHGAWCWKRLTPLLQAGGYQVFTPTLTGFAERSNELTPLHAMPFGIEEVFGVTQEPDLSWVKSMVTPQSLKTFEEQLHLRNPDIVSSKPRTHIYCSGGGTFLTRTVFNLMRRSLMRRTLPPKGSGWRLRQLPTGHDCMITMPRELADLLLEIA